MKTGSRISTVLGAFVAGVLASATAPAADLSYGLDAGVGHTDNVARVENDPQDENIATLGGQLRLDHESRKLRANVATSLEYRDYLDDTYDGELVGNLVGNAELKIIEDRLLWTLEDSFGQVAPNQFAPATPDNRENVNYLSTGPTLTLPFGSRNKLLLNTRYTDIYYEKSELGNQRVKGALALRRALSESTYASFNVATERVRFDDNAESVDFDKNEAFLNYSVDVARTTLSLDAGATEIKSDGQDSSGWLGRLDLTRRVSPSLTVGLGVGHDFSDAGNAFANLQAQQPGSLDPVTVQQTSTPFENNYGTAFLRFSRNRTGIQLGAGLYDEGYETNPLFDRKRVTFNVSFDRNLSASLNATIGADYSREDYSSLDRKFTDTSAKFGLRWKVTRSTNVRLDYQYLDRRSGGDGSDYRANEIWLRFGYLVGERAAGGAGH